MARFKKMVIAGTVPGLSDAKQTEASGPDMQPKTVVAVARSAVRDLPALPPAESDRLASLLRQTVTLTTRRWPGRRSRQRRGCAARCHSPVQNKTARQWVMLPDSWCGRHSATWSIRSGRSRRPTSTSIWQQPRHRADALTTSAATSLYRTGRQLHPQQFPAAMPKNGPPRQQRPIATRSEISRLQWIIPRLPAGLGRRAQACWISATGPERGRRISEALRGTAITSIAVDGRAISVVALPNLGGGVRQVPVVDPDISGRLLALAARVGDNLVLAPHAEVAERNIVNRVSEQLRALGHPRMDPLALRNRWLLDLAERVPAVLLQQLADVCELRILVDKRARVQQYKLRHAITLMTETSSDDPNPQAIVSDRRRRVQHRV